MKKVIIISCIVIGVIAIFFFALHAYLSYVDSFSRGDI